MPARWGVYPARGFFPFFFCTGSGTCLLLIAFAPLCSGLGSSAYRRSSVLRLPWLSCHFRVCFLLLVAASRTCLFRPGWVSYFPGPLTLPWWMGPVPSGHLWVARRSPDWFVDPARYSFVASPPSGGFSCTVFRATPRAASFAFLLSRWSVPHHV